MTTLLEAGHIATASVAARLPSLPLVRMAQPSDEEELMAMYRLLHEENGLFSLDEGKVRAVLARCWNRQGGIVGVIGAPGAIEASICLLISDMVYTTEWHLAEVWNYVGDAYRRSHNADALIEFAKQCSDQIGIPLITGIITNKRMAGKVRLYRRLLGYPSGAFFVYGAKWPDASEQTQEDFWRPFQTRAQERQHEREERRKGK